MTPFATRFSRLTERQRYKTAIVATWGCGAFTGLGVGVGLRLLPAVLQPTLTEGMSANLMAWVALVAWVALFPGVTLLGRFRRLLMRYAPEDDALQPATQTFTDEYLDVTGGCAGECYGDPKVGGCEKATCERLRQQPQPEPNQDTR